MGCLLNLIWFVFGGFIIAVSYVIASLLMIITVVGAPFGMQTMKLALVALWPFGTEIEYVGTSSCLSFLMNVLWLFLGGFFIALCHLVFGFLFCITVIGVPFGLQHFKLMRLALTPFGAVMIK